MSPTLNELTLTPLKKILAYARLEMGLGDMYNSTREYVAKKLLTLPIPNVDHPLADTCYGLKKRDAEDVYQAVYIPGAFKLEGGVIVAQNGDMRGVQPEVFVRTYRLANGQPITSLEKDLLSSAF